MSSYIKLYLCMLSLTVLIPVNCYSEENGQFQKIKAGSCSLDVPKYWKSQDASQRIKIQNLTDNALNSADIKKKSENNVLLALNKYEGKVSVASARLSERYTKMLTQDEVRRLTNADITELSDFMKKENDVVMKKAFKGGTSKLTKLYTRQINGLVSIVTEFEMEADDFKCHQITDMYMLGNKAVKLTVTYHPERESKYLPIVNRIRNSLIIK